MLIVRQSSYLFNFHRGTITAFWYLTFLAMIFLPAFVVYFNQEGASRAQYLFAVESVLITVPLGWWIASLASGFHRSEIDHYFTAQIMEAVPERVLLYRSWVLLSLCFALTVAYLLEVRTVPIFYLIRNPGEFLEAALLREDSFKLLNSPLSYFYYVARGFFYPVVILLSFGAYLKLRTRQWLVTLWISGVSGLFFASLSLAKSPVAVIALLMGVFYYLYRNGNISRKALALVLVLILLFPVVVLTYAYADESVDTWIALTAIGYRLFYLPAEVVYYYFEVFPGQTPYLHGKSVDKFARLMGVKPFDTANAVGVYAYPQGLESVSANGAFIADLYADFGIWGVVLGGVVTGIIMQSVQIFLLRRGKTIVTLTAFSYLLIAFWLLNSTSLPIVLASDGVLFMLLAVWLLERPDGRSREVRPA